MEPTRVRAGVLHTVRCGDVSITTESNDLAVGMHRTLEQFFDAFPSLRGDPTPSIEFNIFARSSQEPAAYVGYTCPLAPLVTVESLRAIANEFDGIVFVPRPRFQRDAFSDTVLRAFGLSPRRLSLVSLWCCSARVVPALPPLARSGSRIRSRVH